MSDYCPSYSTHRHRCPACGWNWTCTCQEPDEHHGFCFECSEKASSVPAEAPEGSGMDSGSDPTKKSRLRASWELWP